MLSRIRNQTGTAGLIVAIVALVAALGGGAYAASTGLNAKQKKEVKSIAKTEAKKVVPATGPQGPAGAKGDAGANGGTGAPGAPGSPGKDGVDGEFGTGPLKTGNTLIGIWGGYPNEAAESVRGFPISFPVPLEEAPSEIVFVGEGELTKPGCPGEVDGVPSADPGVLCVYADIFQEATNQGFAHPEPPATAGGFGSFPPGASKTGTIFKVKCEAFCSAAGTWAVTAE